MTNEEVEKVLEEMQNVRPEMLTEDGKRVFEAIMKIADQRDKCKKLYEEEKTKSTDFESYWVHIDDYRKIKRQNDIKDEYLKNIVGIGFDYDGLDGSIEGLKNVVDELVDYAEKALKNDDSSIIYEGGNGRKFNILREEVKEQKWDIK